MPSLRFLVGGYNTRVVGWNRMESNHVPGIFSPVHTPRLPQFLLCGDEGGTRTHNPLLRRQLLYPIELPRHAVAETEGFEPSEPV